MERQLNVNIKELRREDKEAWEEFCQIVKIHIIIRFTMKFGQKKTYQVLQCRCKRKVIRNLWRFTYRGSKFSPRIIGEETTHYTNNNSNRFTYKAASSKYCIFITQF